MNRVDYAYAGTRPLSRWERLVRAIQASRVYRAIWGWL